MARLALLIVGLTSLVASPAWGGDSVINMPPPPATKSTPAAEEAPPAKDMTGVVALHRYRRGRVGASFTSPPYRTYGYRGPTMYGHHNHAYGYYPYGYGYGAFGYGYFGGGIFHGTLLGSRPFFWGGNTTVTFR